MHKGGCPPPPIAHLLAPGPPTGPLSSASSRGAAAPASPSPLQALPALSARDPGVLAVRSLADGEREGRGREERKVPLPPCFRH